MASPKPDEDSEPRKTRQPSDREYRSEAVGLPARTFMYTIDQIAYMLQVKEETIKRTLLHYEQRSPGICPKNKMRAVNIMPEGETPEWRVAERAFIGYLRNRGIKYYERGYTM